jgi:threonine aldolase
MDGARIWNALVATGQPAYEAAAHVNSLSVCLSKGLGAPAGSLLVGPHELIAKARYVRKGLGGGMRQVGVIAAASLVALDDFEAGILTKDHERAQRLAYGIQVIPGFRLYKPVDTNILFVCTQEEDTAKKLRDKGILATQWEPCLLRLVVHRDLDESDIDKAIQAFREISTKPTQKKGFLERFLTPSA